jgi:glycosyltransferase involved in cell wall biosynthesis
MDIISNPLVSICIPAYNSEKWIQSTIKSALSQTWLNKEIIVVDDGSTDNTYKIAKKFESDSVKVVSQKNSGACAARNYAFSLSKGDYIQWLDADDLLAPDKIEVQLTDCENGNESRILHSAAWGYFYYRISQTKFKHTRLWQDLFPSEWLQIHLGERFFMPTVVWLVSRRLTELAGPWDERLKRNQDGEYICRAVARSEFVKFHLDAKSFYRKANLFSISMTRSKAIVDSLDLANSLCIDHLLNLENNDTTRKACAKFLQAFNNKIHPENSEIILKNQKRILELGGEIIIPTETKKFAIFKSLFGTKISFMLKKWLWNLEIIFRNKWDKLLSFIFKDEIKK